MSRLPLVSSPFRFGANSDFVALRPLLVDGVQLNAGDHLPADSRLRRLPNRLEILCRRRHLSPVTQPVRRLDAAALAPEVAAPVLQEVVRAPRAHTPKRKVKRTAAPPPLPKVKTKKVSKPKPGLLQSLTLRQLQERASELGLSPAGGRDVLVSRITHASV